MSGETVVEQYRKDVVERTACLACKAPAGLPCISLDTGSPVPYVHDDRSMLHHLASKWSLDWDASDG